MAEEILVKEALSPEMVRTGRDVVERLSAEKLPIHSAFWNFRSDDNRWELVIATPRFARKGPKDVYSKIAEALIQEPAIDIDLMDITVVAPTEALPAAIAKALSTGGQIWNGTRFSRNSVNGYYIPDALIYKTP